MKAGLLFLMAGLISVDLSAAETICSKDSVNTALIVIDMQPAFIKRTKDHESFENKTKVGKIIQEQIAAINQAKDANIPIVFLEYAGVYAEQEGDDDTSSELKAAVANYREVKFIKKNTDGMFENGNRYRQELVDYLTKHSVGTLIITGANGGACVKKSIMGALENNCSIVALDKGIADFNFKDFIYPYSYTGVKPTCSDCTFREVSRLDGVIANRTAPSNYRTLNIGQ